MSEYITFAEALHQTIEEVLEEDPKFFCCGLGATDPKGVFGTMTNLHHRFGEERFFDMPTSENGMTGIAIGACLGGQRALMVHQRLDFFLLALDQLVNNAAKWHFMFGGQCSVPLTIRLIIGRGWGQGPTHSQSLQSWFSHIPGLKVVMPTTVNDAKHLLKKSIYDPNPVVFLEHRWLHNQKGRLVSESEWGLDLGKAEIIQEGKDLTIVSSSYMTIEAIQASQYLLEQGISCEIVDVKTLSPIDWPTILGSVEKTKRLIALDTSHRFCSFSSEVVATVSMKLFSQLKQPPEIVALPDIPTPTSFELTKDFYPDWTYLVQKIAAMLDTKIDLPKTDSAVPHDVPGAWFKGPF